MPETAWVQGSVAWAKTSSASAMQATSVSPALRLMLVLFFSIVAAFSSKARSLGVIVVRNLNKSHLRWPHRIASRNPYAADPLVIAPYLVKEPPAGKSIKRKKSANAGPTQCARSP